MDKPIAKKPVYYRYRWHIAGGIAFIVLLVYVGIAASGGRKLRTDAENLIIGEATSDKFLEYVDVEGVVQPILTIQINTREAGSVDRIIAEEGTMMNKGDTILTLNNPDLIRAIEDQQDEWEKQLISYQEKEIEMEQKSIDLQQKTLQTTYELNRLKKSYALDEEEFNMGVKSKAQLEVARDEFDYKTRSTALQLEGLRHDSAATILRRELMKNDLERERKKFERARERMEDLVVRAPLSGQLSFVKVTPGQQVQSTEAIAEIKVLDQFKIHTSLSEYYIDRITTGPPPSPGKTKSTRSGSPKSFRKSKTVTSMSTWSLRRQARRTYASEKVSVSRSNSDNRKRPSSSHVATSSRPPAANGYTN